MLKRLLLLCWLYWYNPVLYADLADISKQLVKAPITQGHFQQEKQLKILHKPLISEGWFVYQQQQGVIWQTVSPVTSLLLINDTHLVNDSGQQNLPPVFGKVFQAVLAADVAVLKESFELAEESQKQSWQFILTPKDDVVKKIISHITLAGDTELRQLTIQETGGNNSRIVFSNISHPAQLTSEQQANFEKLSHQ